MLNNVIMMGRLVKDAETRYIQGSNSSITRFAIAVERDYKAAGQDKPKTDFFNCSAWNKTGEFVAKFFKKGSMIAITGSMETDSYTDRDGKKVYTTYVRVTKADFTGERRSQEPADAGYSSGDEFMNIPDGIDDELPFS